MSGFSVAEVAGELAAFGPYFALDIHRSDSRLDGAWRSVDQLVSDRGLLSGRVDDVRAALATTADVSARQIEWKVAASVTQLGLVSRLLSPLLGIAAITGQLIEVDLAELRWQPVAGSLFPLSLSDSSLSDSSLSDTIESSDWRERSSDRAHSAGDRLLGPMGRLIDATRSIGPVSPRVLWGNVASAINGATNMIVSRRPDLTSVAYPLASTLMREATGTTDGANVGPSYRRHSCCLIYRIAPGRRDAACGDCVLA